MRHCLSTLNGIPSPNPAKIWSCILLGDEIQSIPMLII